MRSRGFDAEINGMLTEAWKPLSSFTPKHSVRVWTDYRLPGLLSRLSVGGGVNAQTESYKTSGAIRFQQGGYAIWSTRASFD